MSIPTLQTPTRRLAPTPAQRAVLDQIRLALADDGIAPTMQELADGLGVSKVTIFEHVGQLERKGWIRRDARLARSIRIIGEACPCCGRVTE